MITRVEVIREVTSRQLQEWREIFFTEELLDYEVGVTNFPNGNVRLFCEDRTLCYFINETTTYPDKMIVLTKVENVICNSVQLFVVGEDLKILVE